MGSVRSAEPTRLTVWRSVCFRWIEPRLYRAPFAAVHSTSTSEYLKYPIAYRALYIFSGVSLISSYQFVLIKMTISDHYYCRSVCLRSFFRSSRARLRSRLQSSIIRYYQTGNRPLSGALTACSSRFSRPGWLSGRLAVSDGRSSNVLSWSTQRTASRNDSLLLARPSNRIATYRNH